MYVGNGVFLGSTLCIWIGIIMKVQDILFSHRVVINHKRTQRIIEIFGVCILSKILKVSVEFFNFIYELYLNL